MRNITDPAEIESVVVFRALNLGDMLCAVPALRALRAWLTPAKIAYVGLPWSRAFFQRFRGYLDEFIEFPGFPGLPEIEPDVRRIPEFLGRIQASRFDLALQMHGSGAVSNKLVGLFGASVSAGFSTEGEYFPRDGWSIPYPEELPEVNRCLKLVQALGAPAAGDELEFPLTAEDFAELLEIRETGGLTAGNYLVVHPGAKARVRRWPPERFAAVCDALSGNSRPVLITGSAQEREIAEKVRQRMKTRAFNLAGRTTLGALAALVKNSMLVVANDTGISHIAAALRVPSVIVFTASDPLRWAPGDRRLHAAVARQIPCRPCSFLVCPIGHPCSREITAEEVIAGGRGVIANAKKGLISAVWA